MNNAFKFLKNWAMAVNNDLLNFIAQEALKKRIRDCPLDPSIKVVVYTSIFGGKDKLREVHRFPGIDYVCFTDNEHLNSKTWKIVPVKGQYNDPRKNAKIYKILPHRFFPDHQYSLWLDGTHIPVVNIKYLIHKFLARHDIALFAHPVRNCLYDELSACIKHNKDDAGIIRRQEEKYRSENYPTANGLTCCAVLLRRHTPLLQNTMEDWWKEILAYSIRDQLSFNYIMHRNNVNYAVLPGDVYNSYFFKYTEHRYHCSYLAAGWVLNGTRETASTRIMGYNTHEYLLSRNIPSIILHQPADRIISSLDDLSRGQIDEMLITAISILILVKVASGKNLDYLIKRCRRKNIKVVYATCDMPSQKMIAKADAIIATSEFFLELIPPWHHHKIHIVFDGYEQPPEWRKEHSEQTSIKACFVSNQVWDKFPCINNLPPDVQLKIIGPNENILKTSFKDSAVFKKSLFAFEYVPWDLSSVYQEILKCDVAVIPWATIGTAEKIKSINRLVLFMALGMPVIASPIPSYLKIIKHGENGFIARTPREWTEYLTFLRDNPKQRQTLGLRARECVLDRYSKEKQGDLYLKIFKSILNDKNT